MSKEKFEAFRKKTRPANRLKQHADEIRDLKRDGYSVKQILVFLEEELDIKCSKTAIYDLLLEDKPEKKKVVVMSNDKPQKEAAKDFFIK